jgi:MFS family permease
MGSGRNAGAGSTDVATATAVASTPGGTTAVRGRWLAFGVVIAAAVMDLLDSTIAQVAAPTIRRELGGSYAVIEWVTAAYTLAMAVGLLTGGRLGDIFGRRRMLLTGMTGFVLASAACAAAGSAGELIAARAAQGLLGAIMLPQVFGLIRDLFAEHEMGKAFGVYGPVMGLSAMLGPIASGGLISANVFGIGWRLIFLVNVPVGLAALVLGARLLPAGITIGARRGRLDLPRRCWPGWPCSGWSSRWRRDMSWAGRAGCSGCWLRRFCCWPVSAAIRCGGSARAGTR